jgi:hypothetical protein
MINICTFMRKSSFKDDVKASKEESNRLEKKNAQLQDEVRLSSTANPKCFRFFSRIQKTLRLTDTAENLIALLNGSAAVNAPIVVRLNP